MPRISHALWAILHHNVDKALLCGGRAAPTFSGGAILAATKMRLYISNFVSREAKNIESKISE